MKSTLITCLLVISCLVARSQNVFNPYVNNSQLPNIEFEITDQNSNSFGYRWWNRFVDILQGYSGEYEILFDRTPWGSVLNLGSGNVHVSLDFEIVSFPFMPDCAFIPQGCSSLVNTTTRNLFLPTTAYDPIDFKWGDLYNKTNIPYYDNSFDQTLVSKAFINDYPFSSSSIRKILPHTAIKHTINIHCGPKVTSSPYPPIVYSFSWIYDHTRGRMRYYPPCNCNNCTTGSCDETDWDISFSPEFVSYNGMNYLYNVSADNLILSQGTLDYFPYNELQNIPFCSLQELTKPSNPSSVFQDWTKVYNHAYFPPFSLVSTPALQWRGINPAGWVYNNTLGLLQAMGGYQHQYYADLNIDLNDISTNDRIFYNPSDVTITASDLHFPSHYSFRTIRGRYPSPAEVANDNTIPNGGPFDPRDVPVRTDLRCEDPSFPDDATVPDDSRYASLYRLAAGSKLTFDPCVKVFDAAFILNPGSVLEFANTSSIKGLHRVAIDRMGGRLIRKYDLASLTNGTLFLQFNVESANSPNTYVADAKIHAGEFVDPNQTPGPYVADVGSNIELIAKEYIKLENGFSALPGSAVKITIDPNLSVAICPPPLSGGSGNRIRNSTTPDISSNAHIKLLPNPFQVATGIFIENKEGDEIQSIVVMDATGKTIKTLSHINTNYSEISLAEFTDGLYFIHVKTFQNQKVFKALKQG